MNKEIIVGSYVKILKEEFTDDFFKVAEINGKQVKLEELDEIFHINLLQIDKEVKIAIASYKEVELFMPKELVLLSDSFNVPNLFNTKEEAFEYLLETNYLITNEDDMFEAGIFFHPIKLINNKPVFKK